MKRALCLLACALWMLAPLAAGGEAPITDEGAQVYAISDVDTAQAETPIPESKRPSFVEKLLGVAREELGYTEGPDNQSKYGSWAGDAHAAWCAEFVCWCVDQTDQRFGTELLTVVYPKYSGQNTGRDWFIARGRFVYRKGNCPEWGYQWLKGAKQLLGKDGYIPRSGDLVFFSYNESGDTEHVALVEYCAKDGGGNVIVHVIEGNNPSSVQRNSYRLSDSQILGYGACEDVIGTTMRFGNRGDKVLELQRSLNSLGLLDENHLTGVYAGHTRAAVGAYQQERMIGQAATGVADRATQQAIEADMERMAYNDPENWLVME